MTENQNPSDRSGGGTRTVEPSWDAEGEDAAALEDGRDDELDTERDDALASGTAYTAGSAESTGSTGSTGSDEDEAEALDETGETDETDETETETTGEAEGVGDAEDADMTGYLPAYREPAAAEPDSEPGAPTGPAVPASPIPGSTAAVEAAVPGPATATALAPAPAPAPATEVAGEQSERMREIQLGFVDDPRHAALEAQELLIDALQSLTEESVRERDALRGSGDETNPDTERMRLAVRRARELIDAVSSTY